MRKRMQKIGSDVRVREFSEAFAGSVRQCQLPIRVITSGVILQRATKSFNQLDGLVACVEFRIMICMHAGYDGLVRHQDISISQALPGQCEVGEIPRASTKTLSVGIHI